jgi:SAM-dependent methyltransferase
VWEYPIVLILACLGGAGVTRRRLSYFEWGWLGVSLVCCAVLLSPISLNREIKAALLMTPAVSALLLRNHTVALVAVLSALALASYAPKIFRDDARAYRSFFGVVLVKTDTAGGLGPVRVMVHGSTVHGTQALDPAKRCTPTSYYTPNTPIGQAFGLEQARHAGLTVGVVGLGTGTVAAFVRPTDRLTFYEIDPLVVKLASDPAKFTYVNGCAKAPVGMVLGDARLRLDKAPDARFDLLLIDAFASDSVPTHLMTVEAMRGYLRVLKPGGVVVLHLSNRNLALIGPAAAAVRMAGGTPLEQLFHSANRDTYVESSSHVVVFARDRAALAPYLASGKWTPPEEAGRAWTDDYTNIVGAIIARIKENAG